MQIGSNDLYDNYRSEYDIANAIIFFLPQVAGDRYNERDLDLNDLLKTRCESSDLNIHFWDHWEFWGIQMSYLASDGVHLQHTHIDARPILKHLRSIRSAIHFIYPVDPVSNDWILFNQCLSSQIIKFYYILPIAIGMWNISHELI